MPAPAVIRLLCETDPSLGTSIVDGLLAWATVFGGCTAFCSGLPAAVAVFIPSRPDSLSRRINRWLGYGFVIGMPLGLSTLFVFIDRLVL